MNHEEAMVAERAVINLLAAAEAAAVRGDDAVAQRIGPLMADVEESAAGLSHLNLSLFAALLDLPEFQDAVQRLSSSQVERVGLGDFDEINAALTNPVQKPTSAVAPLIAVAKQIAQDPQTAAPGTRLWQRLRRALPGANNASSSTGG